MPDPVNLRQARKAKARAEADRKAAENRVIHGRSKSEKQLAKAEAERLRAAIDGARRERD